MSLHSANLVPYKHGKFKINSYCTFGRGVRRGFDRVGKFLVMQKVNFNILYSVTVFTNLLI